MADSVRHLDGPTLAALLAAPGAHLELAAHLAEPCEQCEAFLASQGGDALDGALDAALLSLAPPREAPLHEAGLARVLAGMRPPRRRSRLAWAAAATLALAGGVLLVLPRPVDLDGGVKGGAVEVVELKVVWRDAGGSLSPVGPGVELPPRGALLFRARSPRAGHGLLLVQRGQAVPELLHAVEVQVGLADLRSPEGALGFSLDAEAGPVTVWLVVRDGPTSPSLEAAVEAVHSAGARGLALGRFDLRVTP